MNDSAYRTTGHEVWLDDETLALLALARDGGLAIRLPMACGHSETFNADDPRLRQYVSQPCTRCCLLRGVEEKR